MKKMLCLVLSLMMLFACSAYAEEEVEKEITFQGVPWGSTIEEMSKIWIDNGFLIESMPFQHSYMSPNVADYLTLKENGITLSYPIDDYMPIRGEWHCNPGWLVEGTKIAGYEVAEIVMCFARDDIESELLSVLIVLDATDTEEAYGDLTSKLSQLYGEYDEGNFEESFVEMSDWKGSFNVWQGANNTAVMLAKRYGSRISLIYGTLDAQDILDAYYAEYQANTPTPAPVDSTDTSGL